MPRCPAAPTPVCAAALGSTSDLTSLPECTELDRMLVRATEAALDASVNIPDSQQHHQQQTQPLFDANVNNEFTSEQQQEAPSSYQAVPPRAPRTPQDVGGGGGAPTKGGLRHRFRSLFGLRKGKASPTQEGPGEAGRARDCELLQLRQQLFLQHQHQQERRPSGPDAKLAVPSAHPVDRQSAATASPRQPPMTCDSHKKLRGVCGSACCAVTPQPELINVSNTSTPKMTPKQKLNKLKKLRRQAQHQQQQQRHHVLPEQTQQHMHESQQLQSVESTTPSAIIKNEANTEGGAAATPEADTVIAGTSPPPFVHVFRGGPTTAEHKRIRDQVFRECRVIPVNTLYKKVALVAGRERLLLSAPSNPRSMGSPLLYDIAYENARHHADCNRDFVRVGLKKICSNYCRPSQFRYVY